MGEDPLGRQVLALPIGGPIDDIGDPHENITAALFARLDDLTPKLIQVPGPRINNASRCPQGHKVSHAQFGELFDQKLSPITPRKRSGQFETKSDFPLDLVNGLNPERNGALADGSDHGPVIVAIAVEQGNLLAGTNSANMEKMMRFGPFQDDGPGSQRSIYEKTFRHALSLTLPQPGLHQCRKHGKRR